MSTILVGTDDGFVAVGTEVRDPRGHQMNAVAADDDVIWAISDRSALWRHQLSGEAEVIAELDEGRAWCVAPRGGEVWVGASEARLLRLANNALVRDEAFDTAPGRDTWHTPWGGPPDVRSLSVGPEGRLYVNVHVGGVLVADGDRWQPTMDIHADVHEVVADPAAAGISYAASARGLGHTTDAGASWSFTTEGLHAAYCRAVAVGADTILLSASRGSGGRQAAVYRAPRDLSSPFVRCEEGLPEWFADNVDTFCLAVGDDLQVIAADGAVFVSDDGGVTWDQAEADLGRVHCVLLL